MDYTEIKVSKFEILKMNGMAFLHGMTVGGLASSTAFWFYYDQYRPMVAAACIAAGIECAIHFMRAVDP